MRIHTISLMIFVLVIALSGMTPPAARAQDAKSGKDKVIVKKKKMTVRSSGEATGKGEKQNSLHVTVTPDDEDDDAEITIESDDEDGHGWVLSPGPGFGGIRPPHIPRGTIRMLQRFQDRFDIPDMENFDLSLDHLRDMGEMNAFWAFADEPDSASMQQQKEISELNKRTHELARSYRKAATNEEKAKIEAELQTTVQQQFDLREQGKQLRLQKRQAELQRTQERLNERKQNRGSIIKKRIDELLQKPDELEW